MENKTFDKLKRVREIHVVCVASKIDENGGVIFWSAVKGIGFAVTRGDGQSAGHNGMISNFLFASERAR